MYTAHTQRPRYTERSRCAGQSQRNPVHPALPVMPSWCLTQLRAGSRLRQRHKLMPVEETQSGPSSGVHTTLVFTSTCLTAIPGHFRGSCLWEAFLTSCGRYPGQESNTTWHPQSSKGTAGQHPPPTSTPLDLCPMPTRPTPLFPSFLKALQLLSQATQATTL